tara:strand:- start:303 stop:485 length:183 start_codon:yes stop_codon:yes gene_type:complete
MTPTEMTAALQKLKELNATANEIVDRREGATEAYCSIIDQMIVVENKVLDAGGKLPYGSA